MTTTSRDVTKQPRAPYPTAPPGSKMQDLFDRLKAARRRYDGSESAGGNFQCPLHRDQHPSLHVDVGSRGQDVVCVCRSCGASLPAVLDALAARGAPVVGGKRLVPAASPLKGSRVEADAVDWGATHAQGSGRSRVVRGELGKYLRTVCWDYLTRSGEPMRRTVRADYERGKVLTQLRPHTSSSGYMTWVAGVSGVPVTPLNAELFDEWQDAGLRSLFVCEGEKSVDALTEAGFAATTYPQGANGPLPSAEEVRQHFEGFASFKVWADFDEPGVRRAFKVADLLGDALPDAQVEVVMNDVLFRGEKGADAADIPPNVRDANHTQSPGCHSVSNLAHGLRSVLEGTQEVEAPEGSAMSAEVDREGQLSTWAKVDLAAALRRARNGYRIEATMGLRLDGEGCLYPARFNLLFGDSESGKSMVCFAWAVERLRLGETVVVIDYEDSDDGLLQRLNDLGASWEEVEAWVNAERLRYVNPDGEPTDEALAELCSCASYVVIDATTESVTSMGLNDNYGTDIAAWQRALPKKIAKMFGSTVVAIDHTSHGWEKKDRPTGSQHKKSGVDGVQIQVENTVPFVRGRGGASRLVVSKDRHAAVRAVSAKTGSRRFVFGEFTLTHPEEQLTDIAGRKTNWVITQVEETHQAEHSAVERALAAERDFVFKILGALKEHPPVRPSVSEVKRSVELSGVKVGDKNRYTAAFMQRLVESGFLNPDYTFRTWPREGWIGFDDERIAEAAEYADRPGSQPVSTSDQSPPSQRQDTRDTRRPRTKASR